MHGAPDHAIERIYHEWDSALGAKDAEAATALYHPDATLESPYEMAALPGGTLVACGSAHAVGGVVDDERRLEADVLGAGELQGDGLAGVAGQVVGVLGVPGGGVEVGEGRQRAENRAGAVQHLDLQRVVPGGRCRLRGVDVQPEARLVGGAAARHRYRLGHGIGVRRAVTVQPG